MIQEQQQQYQVLGVSPAGRDNVAAGAAPLYGGSNWGSERNVDALLTHDGGSGAKGWQVKRGTPSHGREPAGRSVRATPRWLSLPRKSATGQKEGSRVPVVKLANGERLRATMIDLDFELYPSNRTTLKNLVGILNRYLFLAEEACQEQPGQKMLCIVLRARPEVISRVAAMKEACRANWVFIVRRPVGDNAFEEIYLRVAFLAIDPAAQAVGVQKKFPTGTLDPNEMRKAFQNLQKPNRV